MHNAARGTRHGMRGMFAAALATLTVVALAALGGIGYAASGGGSTFAAEYQYGKKVTICHKGKTISVSVNALKGHTRHGDTLGTCAAAKAKAAKIKAQKAKAKAKAAKAKAQKAKAKAQEAKARGKSDERGSGGAGNKGGGKK